MFASNVSLQTNSVPSACFSSGIQTLPHNAKVHYNYANFLKDSGRHQEAIYHYTTALRSVSELKSSDCTYSCSYSHSIWVQLLPNADRAASFICCFGYSLSRWSAELNLEEVSRQEESPVVLLFNLILAIFTVSFISLLFWRGVTPPASSFVLCTGGKTIIIHPSVMTASHIGSDDNNSATRM